MEMMKNSMVVQVQAVLLMMLVVVRISPVLCCQSNGKGCKDCIVDQMNHDCPSCTPLLQCMAKCLWSGANSTSSCTKKCDCNSGYPTLSDCKRCMSNCKCNCLN